MATFQIRGRDEILLRMAARLLARTRMTDLNPGSGVLQAMAATAREVEDIHVQVALLLDLLDPEKMDDDALDAWAAAVLPSKVAPRRGATYGTTSVVLGTTGAALVPVPRDSIVGAGSTLYKTTASVVIPIGGTIPVAVQALTAGSAGNVGSGTITRRVTSIPGWDTVTNPVAVVNGEDQELNSSFLDRIKRWMRAQAGNAVPSALESLALTIGVTEHADSTPAAVDPGTAIKVYEDTTPTVRRVRYSKLVEDWWWPGVSTLYVDDGTGFAGVAASQLYVALADEVLTAAALGGERRFQTTWWPHELGTAFTLQKDSGGGWAALVEGVDYVRNAGNGWIVLAAALAVGDALRVHAYTTSLDLIRAVQWAIEGDPADRITWPGWRGSGLIVYVRRPTIVPIDVIGTITTAYGYDHAAVASDCEAAVTAYLNTLPIGANVIWAQLIEEIMAVPGVTDVTLSTPTSSVAVPDQNVARAGTITLG